MNILSIVHGFKIPFSRTPFQYGPLQLVRVNPEERLQINSEIKERCNRQVNSEPGEFLSNLFFVNKKDGDHRPVINLKFLNGFIPYEHFKMEGMHLIKDLLQENNFLIKIDLKDAYFGIPLDKSSRKYIRFQWEGNLCEFLCLFWPVSGPFDFHKTSEDRNCFIKEKQCKNNNLFGLHASSPLSANPTKWLNTLKQFVGNLPANCLSVFDHFMNLPLKGLMVQTLKRISQENETLILLQNLGFVINLKMLHPNTSFGNRVFGG